MPPLQRCTSAALRSAISDSCRALFALACRGMAERRERDLLAERLVQLLDELGHLRSLIEASRATTPAAFDAEQRALSAPPERGFSYVRQNRSYVSWIAKVVDAMGVGDLSCAAPTAALAARSVDLMRKMLGPKPSWRSPMNFPDRDYERVVPLLPLLPHMRSTRRPPSCDSK